MYILSIYQMKAYVCVYFIQDLSPNISLILSKHYIHIHNIHLEGTMAQISDMEPSFIFMTRSGKHLNHFSQLFVYISKDKY